MGLMLALLVCLLAATAGVVAIAAARNGVMAQDADADLLTARIREQRRHIAEVSQPHHVR